MFKNDLFKIGAAHTFYGIIAKLISIFGVVFFYQIFDNSISKALLVFSAIHGLHAILVLINVRITARIGLNNSASLGLLFFGATFILLNLFESSKNINYVYIYVILFALGKSFYHVPVTVYKANYIEAKKAGKEVGMLILFWNMIELIIPLLGGVFSYFFGSKGLMFLGISALIPSIYFYKSLPNIKFNFTLKFRDFYKDRTLKNILELSLFKALNNPINYVWSIWLFINLNSNFSNLGIFSSVLMLISMIAVKLFGQFLDKHNTKETLHRLGFLRGIDYFFKFFSGNQFVLVFSDLYGRIAKGIFSVTYDTYLFSWIDHHNQLDLMDERATVSEFELNGLVSIFFGLLAWFYHNGAPINYGFSIFGVLYILLFLLLEIQTYRSKRL